MTTIYLIFAGADYYPDRGWDGLVEVIDNDNEAAWRRYAHVRADWKQLVAIERDPDRGISTQRVIDACPERK